MTKQVLLQDAVRLSGAAYTVGDDGRGGPFFVCRGRCPHRPAGGHMGPAPTETHLFRGAFPWGNSKLRGGRRPPPNHDPTKWSWFGEEEQGNGATDTRQGVRSEMDFATTTLPLPSITWDRCFYLFTARLGGAAYIVGRGRAGGGGRALQKAHDRAGGQRPPLQNGNS